MLNAIDKFCIENKWLKQGLGVWPENKRAIAAYLKLGFIAGGVLGVAVAVNYLSEQTNQLYQLGGLLLSVIICALLCEFIFGKIGLLFRGLLFIPPLKSIDSLLGAALSLLRGGVFIYLLSLIMVATTFSIGDKYIAPSKFYKTVDSHLPKVADDLRNEVMQLFKKLG